MSPLRRIFGSSRRRSESLSHLSLSIVPASVPDLELIVPLTDRLRASMKTLVVEALSYSADSAPADMRVNGLQGPQAFLDAVEEFVN